MPVEALRKQWDARGAKAPLYAAMTFVGDELVLGAGTRLAVAKRASGRGADEDLPGNDARLIALLAAAHRRPVGPSTLAHIQRALAKQGEGETVLALVHLALTGSSKLEHPKEDAQRLFMADGLMKAGVTPRLILRAMEFDDGSLDDLERLYNPSQPRVSAGNGRVSGQWASSDRGSGIVDTATNSDARVFLAASGENDEEDNRGEEPAPPDPNAPGLSQRLERDLVENGVTTQVAGISIWGTARVVDGVAIYEIGGFYAPEDEPQNLFRFVREVDQISWRLGARSVQIYGFGIINQRLFNPGIASRLGYSFERLDSGNVIRLTKTLFGGD